MDAFFHFLEFTTKYHRYERELHIIILFRTLQYEADYVCKYKKYRKYYNEVSHYHENFTMNFENKTNLNDWLQISQSNVMKHDQIT